MELIWEDGFEIRFTIGEGEGILSANKEGLLSLANHLKTLAEGASGDHIHLDRYNSLEDGYAGLILEKIG